MDALASVVVKLHPKVTAFVQYKPHIAVLRVVVSPVHLSDGSTYRLYSGSGKQIGPEFLYVRNNEMTFTFPNVSLETVKDGIYISANDKFIRDVDILVSVVFLVPRFIATY
eukprot:816937_1